MLSQTVLDRLREAGHAVERLRFNVALGENARSPTVTRVGKSPLPTPLEHCIEQVDDPELRSALGDAAAYSLGRVKDV